MHPLIHTMPPLMHRYNCPYRPQIIWNDLLSGNGYNSYKKRNLLLRHLPSAISTSTSTSTSATATANTYQYQSQLDNAIQLQADVSVLALRTNAVCDIYPALLPLYPPTWTNSSGLVQAYSDLYADAAFECSTCSYNSSTANSGQYFKGTMWVSMADPYQYALLPFTANSTVGLGVDWDEPDSNGYDWDSMGCAWDSDGRSDDAVPDHDVISALSRQGFESPFMSQEHIALRYMNHLSNSLLNPTQSSETFEIQVGFSTYGRLVFDGYIFSGFVSFMFTMVGMMLLNGFWPMSVWRLAYERTNSLVGMMYTVGMGKMTYLSGMFMFDVLISTTTGVVMVLFAKGVKLQAFGEGIGNTITL